MTGFLPREASFLYCVLSSIVSRGSLSVIPIEPLVHRIFGANSAITEIPKKSVRSSSASERDGLSSALVREILQVEDFLPIVLTFCHKIFNFSISECRVPIISLVSWNEGLRRPS